MKQVNFGVVVFPGTNCDRDTFWVLSEVCKSKVRYVWHTETSIDDLDVVILAGGFSYGDYLRSGAIAHYSPVMQEVKRHAEKGKLVLGICNGFQILAETHLVKGAFLHNKTQHFLCQKQHLKVATTNSPFTGLYRSGEVIQIPIAHGEGNYFLPQKDLEEALEHDLVVFRYCDENGVVSQDTNPNGSTDSIAGILNRQRNVLGMMPHPERSSEFEMGSIDGKRIFEGIIQWIQSA
ncbi:phosphoribosylformylglycinamidine synthase subunit PurQ [Thermospira aquatica]|uniref:Phosphoribosylformylglycinamidine synthase subunit PurQ n=1 Tax=Thermospira aquatica TaxID=2828656 RepID=A0AAX3BFY0_9SPIR|nr:phosphoribosylformylglycinamidine synthase subunit PurQ [Thermospira aquatica]URA11156.1 phosphoribosylformylglycinamidine synthase subunit PurQ [Thermospira aquatica]